MNKMKTQAPIPLQPPLQRCNTSTTIWQARSHAIKTRGNSLETPNVWVLSSFHPNVSKQPPPPQCLGFVLFSHRRFYRAELAATWMPLQQLTGHGSHVAAMSAQGKTKKAPCQHRAKEKIAAGREDSGGERRREGAADLLKRKTRLSSFRPCRASAVLPPTARATFSQRSGVSLSYAASAFSNRLFSISVHVEVKLDSTYNAGVGRDGEIKVSSSEIQPFFAV